MKKTILLFYCFFHDLVGFTLVVVLLLPFFMMSCAAKAVPVNNEDELRILAEIGRATTIISEENRKLRQLLEARSRKKLVVALPPPPGDAINNLISFRWSGPLYSALRVLSFKAGYQLTVAGRRPSQPIMVVVDEPKTPIYIIINRIKWQTEHAKILVIYKKKNIILQYAPAHKVGAP